MPETTYSSDDKHRNTQKVNKNSPPHKLAKHITSVQKNTNVSLVNSSHERRKFRTLARSYLFGDKKEEVANRDVCTHNCYSRPHNKNYSYLLKQNFEKMKFANEKQEMFAKEYEVTNSSNSSCSFVVADAAVDAVTTSQFPITTQSFSIEQRESNNSTQNTNLDHCKISVSLSNCNMNDALHDYWSSGQKYTFCDTRKVVLFDCLAEGTDVESVLNQVYCGPLDRIVKKSHPQIPCSIKSLEIHFMEHDAAETFHRFAQSKLFVVNGVHPQCTWASPEINENSIISFQNIRQLVYPENEQVFSQHGGSSIRTGARRSLILKRQTPKKTLPYNIYKNNPYVVSSTSLAELDISKLLNDFQIFGDIVNITPVVSRRLCVCINYYNVRSAIQAKRAFEQAETLLHNKYHEQWVLWYGKDISDRPCFNN